MNLMCAIASWFMQVYKCDFFLVIPRFKSKKESELKYLFNYSKIPVSDHIYIYGNIMWANLIPATSLDNYNVQIL